MMAVEEVVEAVLLGRVAVLRASARLIVHPAATVSSAAMMAAEEAVEPVLKAKAAELMDNALKAVSLIAWTNNADRTVVVASVATAPMGSPATVQASVRSHPLDAVM